MFMVLNTEQMKHPREERVTDPLRTLDSLESDLLEFQTAVAMEI